MLNRFKKDENLYMGFNKNSFKQPSLEEIRKYARLRSTKGLTDSNMTGKLVGTSNGSETFASIHPKRIFWTGYLANLLTKNGIDTEGKLGDSGTTQTSNIYEAVLTQTCYMARLAYSPADIFCRMVKFLDYSPDAFNDYLRAIEEVYENSDIDYVCSYNSLYLLKNENYKKVFNLTDVKVEQATDKKGFFHQNEKLLNLYGYVYNNPASKINNESTLYIAFKGASNFQEFWKSIKSVAQTKENLSNKYGNIQNLSSYKIEHLVKKYFIRNQQSDLEEILKKMNELISSNGVKKIIITGHSLGGALASFFGYWLRKYASAKNNPVKDLPIHIITFGEIKSIGDDSKSKFNEMLLEPLKDPQNFPVTITYDRVNNITKVLGKETAKNVLTALPPGSSHPGYDQESEAFLFSKFGLTNEIKEFRQMCGWVDLKGEPSTKNDYPANEAFVKLFENMNGDTFYTKKFFQNGQFNSELYYKRFTKSYSVFGTTKKNRIEISKNAMKNATPAGLNKVRRAEEKSQNVPQAGGENKVRTYDNMPNMVTYNCYALFPTAMYMGVSFVYVLRNPLMARKPDINFDLYMINDRLYSINKENLECFPKESIGKNIVSATSKAKERASELASSAKSSLSSMADTAKAKVSEITRSEQRNNNNTGKRNNGNSSNLGKNNSGNKKEEKKEESKGWKCTIL